MDDNGERPDKLAGARIGYQLLWQAVALLALLAVPVLFFAGLWLTFQDYGDAERRAVRVLVPVVLVGSVAVVWRKRRHKASSRR
jgi:hypothetical protein